MKVYSKIEGFRLWRRAVGELVGFVPTMGNLHAGHLACLRVARQSAPVCVASIFVNPLQFGPNEDFARYPRTLDDDLALLEEAGCDAVFVPAIDEIVGPAVGATVRAGSLASGLEGGFRPGHFDGVATICLKLFHIVQPSCVAMGNKDLQQLRVVGQMISDFNMPIHLLRVPTYREASGLAMSSRNRYLSDDSRAAAVQLYEVLRRTWVQVSGGTEVGTAQRDAVATLEGGGWQVDYVVVRDSETLQAINGATREVAVLGAARLNGVRLIDNITVELRPTESSTKTA